jgi:acyl-coenzyme A synthetase/AMP-(fatty) acid ligase
MNYTFGLSIINTHLAVGATILLTDKTIIQRDFWNFMSINKATSFSGVPYTYEILNKLSFFRRQLPTLKTMTQAGGKLLPELHQKFAEWAETSGKNFVVMYGSAEATARMGYLPPEISLKKCGCMGKAIPGGKFILTDGNGRKITSTNTVGELVYEGENVMLGYALSGEDLAKGDENHGHLLTGDMAKFDSDGIYTIVGRKKRFLKIFGNRIGLDETERLIKSHFDDIECACAGIDDKMHVYITKADLCTPVRLFLADKTKLNQAAFDVQCVKSIPKNASGKTLYQELEKMYAK